MWKVVKENEIVAVHYPLTVTKTHWFIVQAGNGIVKAFDTCGNYGKISSWMNFSFSSTYSFIVRETA